MKKGSVELMKFLIGAVIALIVIALFWAVFSPLGELFGSKAENAAKTNFEAMVNKINSLLNDPEEFATTSMIYNLPGGYSLVGFDSALGRYVDFDYTDSFLRIPKPVICSESACLCLYNEIYDKFDSGKAFNSETTDGIRCNQFKGNDGVAIDKIRFLGPDDHSKKKELQFNHGSDKSPNPSSGYQFFTRINDYEFFYLPQKSDGKTIQLYMEKKKLDGEIYIFIGEYNQWGYRKNLDKPLQGIIKYTLDFKGQHIMHERDIDENDEVDKDEIDDASSLIFRVNEGGKQYLFGIMLDSIQECESEKPISLLNKGKIDDSNFCTKPLTEFEDHMIVRDNGGNYRIYKSIARGYNELGRIDGKTGQITWGNIEDEPIFDQFKSVFYGTKNSLYVDACHLQDLVTTSIGFSESEKSQGSYLPDEVWIYESSSGPFRKLVKNSKGNYECMEVSETTTTK